MYFQSFIGISWGLCFVKKTFFLIDLDTILGIRNVETNKILDKLSSGPQKPSKLKTEIHTWGGIKFRTSSVRPQWSIAFNFFFISYLINFHITVSFICVAHIQYKNGQAKQLDVTIHWSSLLDEWGTRYLQKNSLLLSLERKPQNFHSSLLSAGWEYLNHTF